MTTLFCPDCGTNCEHTGTNVFQNQWCFDCSVCSSHWMRYSGHVESIHVAECEIPHIHSSEPECLLCNQPSTSGTVHQECADREQAMADQE